ncbi:TetR/AcrR family transcriptional regulator [uncultured Ferrimonas sp.]|uniref:TetR/AcrR family transcriptional regulator n=1 Tax=uncultured Ferrimonas sp. TaxID=432640 RepID=UPI00261F40B7|nr:TetR/AcrR family transcriptional regulator [uncultured Ferrimonas sp.]
MSKMEQKRAEKRHAILTAAEHTFLSQGYLSASMDAIARLAAVTKQTVYRYYPSKLALFAATLAKMGESEEFSFLVHLEEPDNQAALLGFARHFIRAHLSNEHLATYRLLVAEHGKAPELIASFNEQGNDEVGQQLTAFFDQRLRLADANMMVDLFCGMLLAPRSQVLIGMPVPSAAVLEQLAQSATALIMAQVR